MSKNTKAWDAKKAHAAALRFAARSEADARMGLSSDYDAALAATLDAYASQSARIAELEGALRVAQTACNRLFAMSPEGSTARQYAEAEADAIGALLGRGG